MKYIAFFEIRREDFENAIEVEKKRRAEHRTVKTLFPPHTIGKTSPHLSSFIIFESDDEAELAEYVMAYTLAGVKIEVYPIWEEAKSVDVWKSLKNTMY